MGRAFSDIVQRELADSPGIYAMPLARLHAADPSYGPRPIAAPGISAERELALAAGASRIGYGDYSLDAGRLEASLTLENPQTGKIVESITASAGAGDVVTAATELAGQLSRRTAAPGTRNPNAVKAYVMAMEAPDPAVRLQRYADAVAADPAFGPAYDGLAQSRLQQQDRAGAVAVLEQAAAHRSLMSALERARIDFQLANLRGDAAARTGALEMWSRTAPNDPAVWRLMAENAMSRHEYPQAVAAYEKALAIEPDDVSLWNALGYTAAYAGNLDTATRALQRYQALRPADVNPTDSLGDVNLILGRLREAENFYLQTAKRNPDFLGGMDLFKAAMARLMSGDVSGADGLFKRYEENRAAAHDPALDYHRAEWLWTSGRRKEAQQRMSALAQASEAGPLRELASQAYAQLAIWTVVSGNRPVAAQMANKAAMLAGPASAVVSAIVRFLAQPSASATEWAARADTAFPAPAQQPIRDLALSCALLTDKQFEPALQILKRWYDHTPPTADDSVGLLLAWSYLETGKTLEAAPLLRFNPIFSSGGKPFSVYYFPRLFYLRGQVARAAGSPDQARAQFRIFQQLSGDEPLVWGEEEKAR